MRQSKIAYHVQNVIYDTAWEYLIDDFRIKAEKPANKDRLSTAPGKEMLSCSCILQQAVQNQIRAGEDGAAEVAYLSRVFLSLPHVRELTVREAFSSHGASSSLPHYYQHVSKEAGVPTSDIRISGGFGPVDSNHSHTRMFLLAAYSTGIRFDAIDLRDVSWHTFFRQPPFDLAQPANHDFRIRKELFSTIKSLDLTFRGTPSRDYQANLKPLRDLLKSCERLESLYLSFTNIVNRRYTSDNRSFSYLLPLLGDHVSVRPLMPRLRELFLNSVFCTQQDLTYFLAIHGATLRHVSLSNISLLRHESRDSRGCWVKVIKAMKSMLRLDTVYFSGWLSNGGRQVWHISEDASDDDRLRPAVIKYITDRNTRICPLDHVAIVTDRDDLDRPPEGWTEGDWTWTMTYANYKSRGDQTHSGAEMFSKDVSVESDDWAIANPHFWKHPYKKSYPHPDPFPSKKTSPNPSNWSWSDYDSNSSWPAPGKKGKQNAGASSSAWDWTIPPNAPFPAADSWGIPPAQPIDMSQPSTSSHGSVSPVSVSPNNGEAYFPYDDSYDDLVVDLPEGTSPPPPPMPPAPPSGSNHPKTWWSTAEESIGTTIDEILAGGKSDSAASLPSIHPNKYSNTAPKHDGWDPPYESYFDASGPSATTSGPPFSNVPAWQPELSNAEFQLMAHNQQQKLLAGLKAKQQAPLQTPTHIFGYQISHSESGSPAPAKTSAFAEDFSDLNGSSVPLFGGSKSEQKKAIASEASWCERERDGKMDEKG